MNQAPKNNKRLNQNNDKIHAKYNIGNCCLYQYKDPNGKTMQISRPAFIKIENLE
jgi:hypothetical protein